VTETPQIDADGHDAEPPLRVVELQRIPLRLAARAAAHAKYARFADPQRARADAATAAGAETIDLRYEVPAELADDVDQLRILLDEVDSFCRDGELVTLATPDELVAYRTWFLGEFCSQLREGAAPTPWVAPATSATEVAPA
jgi:hypothetical protein